MNMRLTITFLLFACAAMAADNPSGVPFIRETYSKYEYRVAMRDGVKLFTAVYIPKDVASDGRTYPILLVRTPYSIAPYGEDHYPANLGPSELFSREKFIFAYQDVRGRYMSEGDFTIARPQNPVKNGPKDTDESTDAYDTIDWLIKNVPSNTGKVGIWGISQPGFFATAAMINSHPALVAVSPQAPVTDYYLGDDIYHNGAFMLAARFSMYQGFRPRGEEPAPPAPMLPFDYHTPDGYDFYLSMGTLANADERYFKHGNPYWEMNVKNNTYNEFWQARSVWKYLKNVKPAVMLVGGWFDAEDPQGLFRQFYFMEKNSPPSDLLVVGPWTHGGFARGDGDHVGNVSFGSKTAVYFREKIEFPFFLYYLKGKGDSKMPKAWVFETGVNQWRRFDAWPPKTAKCTDWFLGAQGKISPTSSSAETFDEYQSDPAKPVPYIGHVLMGMRYDYMTEDQRFAATRPDVLVYKSEPLDHDVTIAGPITVDLKVSTSGTDSDFDVKLIDVYPGNFPDYDAASNPPGTPGPAAARAQLANAIQLGGYQQLVRGEPFRGKYRKSFETPVPFKPGKPDRITFQMPDVLHTFRAGHRIMIQVQSSWFPLTDRNPQKFVDITNALASDFAKATERVYLGGAEGSKIQVMVLQ
ncbi:MAG: CocE/NonD family hydrolase [Acidobacteriaceae bacterium]|nr:CocE/NonD family hydrolase [Acidobacteriaceae bacterium]MBV9678133.1 CocE/NonD family hydrolase [Acidobacteriaceae bacterium]MBV9938271.1 CocE/NonD family hydrolase [Acidobacteriaceae bacterium]